MSGTWHLATVLPCHEEGGGSSLARPPFCESEFGSICLLTVVYNSMNPWLAQEVDVKWYQSMKMVEQENSSSKIEWFALFSCWYSFLLLICLCFYPCHSTHVLCQSTRDYFRNLMSNKTHNLENKNTSMRNRHWVTRFGLVRGCWYLSCLGQTSQGLWVNKKKPDSLTNWVVGNEYTD